MKIYIIGIVASGKTSISKMLSQELGIARYEVDVIVHPVINGKRLKRSTSEQIDEILRIDKEDNWIIEGTYRESCQELLKRADLIVFLDPPLKVRKRRILTRFIKQQLKVEQCHYTSNLQMLKMMYKWTSDFERDRGQFEDMLSVYKDKLLTITDRTSKAASQKIITLGGIHESISITQSI